MNIFISGIGGTGLGPLAEIALDAGFHVVGSDLSPSPVSRELEKRGVDIAYEQSSESIAKAHRSAPIDWLVYTSALPSDSPELEFARQNHIKATKRDAFLASFIRDHNLDLIAVAGTHGKTSTTALMVWVLKGLGLPVSYSIGTTLQFGSGGEFDAKSKFFVYEADEYDRNFLSFEPRLSIIPSVDYDHPDTYPSRENYISAFNQFISQSGQTLLWRGAADYLGVDKDNANLTILQGDVSKSEIELAGSAMRANAKLVLEALRQMLDDFDEARVTELLASFPGSDRRFEKLADNLYTDYAHHPIEIAATIEKAREMSDKIVVIYQPHQNLRQAELMRDGGYSATFSGVDHIYWIPTYLVRADLVDGAPAVLEPADLIATLSNRDQAEPAELDEHLWQKVTEYLADNYLVLFMGAGPIDGWLRQQINHHS